MLCDSCSINIAVVHVHEVVDGVNKTVHLCAPCAEEIEIPSVSLDNLSITGIIDQKDNAGVTLIKQLTGSAPKVCLTCGNTTDAVRRTGRLGCSDCYELFRDFLDEIVPHVHRGVRHYGKNSPVKTRNPQAPAADTEIQSIRSDLADAVLDENFECAAKLRDLLREIETEAKEVSRNECQ